MEGSIVASEPPESGTVLIVEDETDVAHLYTRILSKDHDVRTAHDGEEALELFDETVDVVLLDRRLPGKSGDKVLTEVRKRGHDCRVAMVSAVEPDFEIADFPIDDYLVKPVDNDELRNAVEDLLLRSTIDVGRQELFALVSRRRTLEDQKRRSELEDNPEYQKLCNRITEITEKLETNPSSISSAHRPDFCPDCGLRWDLDVDGLVGFLPLAADVWKCTRCGEIVHEPESRGRQVSKR